VENRLIASEMDIIAGIGVPPLHSTLNAHHFTTLADAFGRQRESGKRDRGTSKAGRPLLDQNGLSVEAGPLDQQTSTRLGKFSSPTHHGNMPKIVF